ncbi:hypothetical protein J1G42_00425 [Cellulomonas sp. zg-ZUI222]|uniref:Uncharacterized protein n=1 Tax=Cellulomonas wangleii TaxID=2816956 RepID=A0ABX8D7T3_9CELL|nr:MULTISPECIES: hypothetical protein [Cellulomonas]MBO0898428.1 hypothetical protein [Cellulomonas sp. zg-ZUI22]MBO0919291.1 hypothetical protein [Cellulomonas wangleii]MBO0924563.1 hypothetical protein [Cellulomonas wangleii]QVI62546.1 hypothetical protein KG103_00890 [Cellulomonas wangleii]
MGTYWDLDALRDLYLEDSWILDVVARPGIVELTADFVLLESHPLYRTPAAGEQYCYQRGTLRFAGVRSLSWEHQSEVCPAVDATGERDYGSIDTLDRSADTFTLIGDFGRMVIDAPEPSVELRSGRRGP